MTTIFIVLPLLFLAMFIGVVYWEMRRKSMRTKARIRAWRERGTPAQPEEAKGIAQTNAPAAGTHVAPDKQRVILLPARTHNSSLKKAEEIEPDSRRRYRS